MTWTWDPTMLGTSELMQVRAEVQDVDVNNQLLSDEEIDAFISVERNFWSACARSAEVISRGFLRKQDVKLGRSMQIVYSRAAAQWQQMAVALRRKALGTVAPFVGGMSVSVKIAYLNDSDILAALVTKTAMVNPWTGGYTSDSLLPVGNSTDDAGYEFT